MLLLFSLLFLRDLIIFTHLKIIFIFLVHLKTVPFGNLLSLLFHTVLFVSIELVALTDESDVGSFLFDLAVLNFLFILRVKVL